MDPKLIYFASADCGPPTDVPFAGYNHTGTLEGETAVYYCKEGYSFKDGSVEINVKCQANAQWEDVDQSCLGE